MDDMGKLMQEVLDMTLEIFHFLSNSIDKRLKIYYLFWVLISKYFSM